VGEGHAIEACFGVTTADVGKQRRDHEVTNAATGGPRTLHLLFAVDAEAAQADETGRLQVALEAAEVVIGECADDPAIGELIIATDLDGAEPALATRVRLTRGEGHAERVDGAVTLVDHAVAAAGAKIAAGPAVRRDRSRTHWPGLHGQVGGKRRACDAGGERDGEKSLFHFQSPRAWL
jgi:hypothetical protein